MPARQRRGSLSSSLCCSCSLMGFLLVDSFDHFRERTLQSRDNRVTHDDSARCLQDTPGKSGAPRRCRGYSGRNNPRSAMHVPGPVLNPTRRRVEKSRVTVSTTPGAIEKDSRYEVRRHVLHVKLARTSLLALPRPGHFAPRDRPRRLESCSRASFRPVEPLDHPSLRRPAKAVRIRTKASPRFCDLESMRRPNCLR